MSAPPTPFAGIVTTPVQGKPWGSEVIFATGENGYVGKVISVTASQALSLQYHREKDETISVISGELVVEYGIDVDHLEHRLMQPGDTIHLPPTFVHRMTAVTDAVVVEASTAGPGWRGDVVRLSDRYGRTGTSAP
jgi:mannose-6-phosphate isomerase